VNCGIAPPFAAGDPKTTQTDTSIGVAGLRESDVPRGWGDAYLRSMPKPALHRVKISRKARGKRPERQDQLPLDPRDPDVVRAKVSRKRA
jgi:hypothetical protein